MSDNSPEFPRDKLDRGKLTSRTIEFVIVSSNYLLFARVIDNPSPNEVITLLTNLFYYLHYFASI